MTDLPVDRRLGGGPRPGQAGEPDAPVRDALRRAVATLAAHPRVAAAALGTWTLLLSALALRSPAAVIGTLLALVLLVMVVRYPEAAVCALLLLVPFHFALYSVVTGRLHVHVGNATLWKDLLVGALLVRGLVRQIAARRSFSEMLAPGDRGLVAYGLFLALLATVSPDLTTAGYALATVVEGPMLFLAIMLLRPGRRALRAALWSMLAAAGIMAVVALIEQAGPKAAFDPWFGGLAPLPNSSFFLNGGSIYRSGAFFASPLQLAFYGAAAAALATGVAIGTRGAARVLATLVAILSTAAVVVSFTRSGYIGGGVGVMLVLLLGVRRVPLRLALMGTVATVAVAAVTFSVASGDEHLSHSGEGSSHVDILRADLNLFAFQPLGYGLGSVDAIAQRFDRNSGFATESTLLATGMQGGIEELVAYLVVLFWTAMRVRTARRAAMAAGDWEAAGICAGALGAQWAVFLAGLFLGVQALPVELVLWGAPAIALAFTGSRVSSKVSQPL